MTSVKQRADLLLVERQLASSRTQAQRMIAAGQVALREAGRWRTLDKASEKLSSDSELQIERPDHEFVSRGGFKLQGALAAFNIDPSGLTALDVGQSTGGFTDCLLQSGAAKVVGVDVGHDQLAPALRADPRVVALEGINARQLPSEQLLVHAPGGFDLIVMDVSFISQTLILPGLVPLVAAEGRIVTLVKPQFEVGKAGIGKGGIVRDASRYDAVEKRLSECCQSAGLQVLGYCESPITGTDGNREFLLCAAK